MIRAPGSCGVIMCMRIRSSEASARRGSRRPVRLWVSAAARLIQTTASTNAGSGRSPEMGKFSTARWVWMP